MPHRRAGDGRLQQELADAAEKATLGSLGDLDETLRTFLDAPCNSQITCVDLNEPEIHRSSSGFRRPLRNGGESQQLVNTGRHGSRVGRGAACSGRLRVAKRYSCLTKRIAFDSEVLQACADAAAKRVFERLGDRIEMIACEFLGACSRAHGERSCFELDHRITYRSAIGFRWSLRSGGKTQELVVVARCGNVIRRGAPFPRTVGAWDLTCPPGLTTYDGAYLQACADSAAKAVFESVGGEMEELSCELLGVPCICHGLTQLHDISDPITKRTKLAFRWSVRRGGELQQIVTVARCGAVVQHGLAFPRRLRNAVHRLDLHERPKDEYQPVVDTGAVMDGDCLEGVANQATAHYIDYHVGRVVKFKPHGWEYVLCAQLTEKQWFCHPGPFELTTGRARADHPFNVSELILKSVATDVWVELPGRPWKRIRPHFLTGSLEAVLKDSNHASAFDALCSFAYWKAEHMRAGSRQLSPNCEADSGGQRLGVIPATIFSLSVCVETPPQFLIDAWNSTCCLQKAEANQSKMLDCLYLPKKGCASQCGPVVKVTATRTWAFDTEYKSGEGVLLWRGGSRQEVLTLLETSAFPICRSGLLGTGVYLSPHICKALQFARGWSCRSMKATCNLSKGFCTCVPCMGVVVLCQVLTGRMVTVSEYVENGSKYRPKRPDVPADADAVMAPGYKDPHHTEVMVRDCASRVKPLFLIEVSFARVAARRSESLNEDNAVEMHKNAFVNALHKICIV